MILQVTLKITELIGETSAEWELLRSRFGRGCGRRARGDAAAQGVEQERWLAFSTLQTGSEMRVAGVSTRLAEAIERV